MWMQEKPKTRQHQMRVLDWEKAWQEIQSRGLKNVTAGIANDMFWTGGSIVENGEKCNGEHGTPCVASSWGTPVIAWEVDGVYCELPCYKTIENPGKNYEIHQLWPAD